MHYPMKDFSEPAFFTNVFLTCYKVKANYQRAYMELMNYCYKNNETFSSFLSRFLKTKEYSWCKFIYTTIVKNPSIMQSERFIKYFGTYTSVGVFVDDIYKGVISNKQIYEYFSFKLKQLNFKDSKVYYALPHSILDLSDNILLPKDKLTYPAQELESVFASYNFLDYPQIPCKLIIKYGSYNGYSVDDICTGLVQLIQLSWRQYLTNIVAVDTLNDEWFIECCGYYTSLDNFKEALITERIAYDEFKRYTFCTNNIISATDKLTILDDYVTYTFFKEL